MKTIATYIEKLSTGILFLFLLTGCTENYRDLDERQLRRQFHVSSDVHLDSLVSSPETGGWFGREGLRVRGVFQFDAQQFEQYVSELSNSRIWEPVSFLSYSPDGAQSCSPTALRWSRLPLTSFPQQLSHLAGLFDTSLSKGSYFCFLLVTVPADQETEAGKGSPYAWTTIGIHGSELDEQQHPTVTTYGILDHDRRRLYAWIGFSG